MSAPFNQITLDGKTVEQVDTFTNVGIIIDKRGESDADVNTRIEKTRDVFLQLKNICKSKQLSVCLSVCQSISQSKT